MNEITKKKESSAAAMLAGQSLPAGYAKTHDYTRSGWGRNTQMWNTNNGGITATCCGWGKGISKGDYILLKNGDSDSRYVFDEIKYYQDPTDMWSAKLSFAPRGA